VVFEFFSLAINHCNFISLYFKEAYKWFVCVYCAYQI